MPTNIDTFRGQFQQIHLDQIRGDHSLRMREDGQGIATTKWERFKVGFFDMFRSRNTIENMKLATTQNFVNALKEKHYNTTDIPVDKPLSARTFKSVMKDFAGTELKYNTTLKMLSDPTVNYGGNNFTENLKTAFKDLQVMANNAGVSSEDFNRFKTEWLDGGKSNIGTPEVRIFASRVSKELEDMYKGDKGKITGEDANKHCIDMAKREITEKFNMMLNRDFRKGKPNDDSIKTAIAQRDQKMIAQMGSPVRVMQMMSAADYFAQTPNDRVISPGDRMQVREASLKRFLDKAEAKMELVNKYVPDSFPKKEGLTNFVLRESTKVDEKFFTGALEFTKNLYGKLDILDIRDLDKASALLTDLGAELNSAIQAAGIEGSDDLAAFTEIGKYLMAAQVGEETIQKLRDKIMEQCDYDPSGFVEHLSDKKFEFDNSDKGAQKTQVAGAAELIFSAITRELSPV